MFNDPELDTTFLKSFLSNNQYHDSNTPKHLLELGRDCPIINQFIGAWMRGNFSFYTCLVELHSHLVDECVRLDTEFNLGYKHIKDILKLPDPALPRLDAVSTNVRMKVYREICPHNELDLIRVIILASKLRGDFSAIAVEKQRFAPMIIRRYNDGRIEVESNVSNSELPTQVGECLESQKLDFS